MLRLASLQQPDVDGEAGRLRERLEEARDGIRLEAADARKFVPHVTLARLRNTSPAEVAKYLSARGNFSAAPFRVGRFVLMSSRDSVGGGPYVIEEAWPLAGAETRTPSHAAASDASRLMR